MKRIKVFIILAGLIFALQAAGNRVFAQRVGNSIVTGYAERHSGDKFYFGAKTRKGANVYGVKMPDARALEAVDKGLDDLFAEARKLGYRNRLNHFYYSIYIARPDRVRDRDGNYSPAFAINAGAYGGGEYDQGGFIYVAGLVFYLNPDAFLIVDFGDDVNKISEIVRYEGEHIILYYNNRKLYQQTADHSRGGAHPILK